MAAAEYFLGSEAARKLQAQQHPYPQQPQPGYQPQPSQSLSQYSTPPPAYSAFGPPPQQQQLLGPQEHAPQPQYQQPPQGYQGYPTQPPATQPPHPQQYQQQQNEYLGVPLQPYRSHSQPPRVHFASDDDSDLSDSSSTDSSSPRRRRHRKHRHSHSHSHSNSHSHHHRSSSFDDREMDRDTRSHLRDTHRKEQKDRSTFLGAGVGGLVGDVIFPGLGTAAGLVLGGYGGRKHAHKKRRSNSDVGHRHGRSDDERVHGTHHGRRRTRDSGWD
jgi:hypothetical protein